MRHHDVEPLFEAIRCELVGVRNRLEAQDRGGPADRPAVPGAARDGARPVTVIAAADRPPAQGPSTGEREVAVPLFAEAVPAARG